MKRDKGRFLGRARIKSILRKRNGLNQSVDAGMRIRKHLLTPRPRR